MLKCPGERTCAGTGTGFGFGHRIGIDSDSDDSDGAAQQWEEEFQNYEPSDIEEEDHEEEDHEQSPPHSLEAQHPAASMYEDLLSKLLIMKGSLRPPTSTSGAVGAPKREFQD
jgi:hypothetical protein